MEETVKKRGRKKTVKEPIKEVIVQIEEEPEKKKRGRKKKWQTTPFKNNYNTEGIEKVKFEETEPLNKDNYTTNALNFGNLCIKVHDKEQEVNTNLDNYFVDNKAAADCELTISSDEEDTCDFKKPICKTTRHYINGLDENMNKLKITNTRCFNCHHTFDNTPFFLPYDYSSMLDRYKLFGNFCSPNCVKAYALNNKTFEKKSYIIGQYYRKLFGPNFRIIPAADILNLKEYGGKITIEEFRKSFYKNTRYTINNINTKVVYIN
tara:strand:+ start:2857 stop:3648 length:792 start_codon:yes stop_codon:yes gene_type:complete